MSKVIGAVGSVVTWVAYRYFGIIGMLVATVATAVASKAATDSEARKARNSLKGKGTTIATREPTASRKIVYGRQRVGGTIIFMATTGTDNKFAHFVVVHADHECDAFEAIQLNADQFTPDVNGNVVCNSGLTYVKTHRGFAGEGAESELVSASGGQWTNSDTVAGCAYSYMRLQWDSEKFPSGVPAISAVLRGKKVYDPRTTTTVWSENPALCILDYLRLDIGLGCSDEEIDFASFIAAANICDESVGGGKRYTCNGIVDTADTPQRILEDMLTSCAGQIVNTGGVWRIIVGADRPVSATFTLDDLRGPLSPQCGDSLRDTCNGVKGVFVSPETQWQPADFAPVTNSTYVSEDGGQQIWRDIELPFTTYSATANRIARIELEKARQDITIPLQLNMAGLAVTVGDIIALPFERYGWNTGGGKLFEVTSWTLTSEQTADGPVPGVDIVAREYTPAIYSGGAATGVDTAPNTTLPNPLIVVAPASLTVTCDSTTAYVQSDGTIVPRILVSWPAPSDAFVTSGGHIQVQFKSGGTGATWRDWAMLPGDQTSDYITDIATGQSYTVRIRSISGLGVPSAWVTSSAVTVSGDLVAPAAPTLLNATPLPRAIKLTWKNPTDADFDHIELYEATASTPAPTSSTAATFVLGSAETYTRDGLGDAEQKYYWARAKDRSGNPSAWEGPVNATSLYDPSVAINITLQQVAQDLAAFVAAASDSAAGLLAEAKKRGSETTNLAQDIATLYAVQGEAVAAFGREITVRATQVDAIAQDLAIMHAQFQDNSAAYLQEVRLRAAQDSSFASSIIALTASVGTLTSTVSVLSAAYIVGGQAIATWGFKLDAGGKVVSMQAVAASGGVQGEVGVITFGGATLQSDGFTAGANGTGWSLYPNGNAEMSNLTLRDSLMLYSIPSVSIDPPGKFFATSLTLNAVCVDSGATIRYTLDGSEVSSGSVAWPTSGGLTLTSSATVRVRAFKTVSGKVKASGETIQHYVSNSTTSTGVASPSINSASAGVGTYNITISCATSGATIFWRIGTSGSWNTYSGAFNAGSGLTIQSYATKSGLTDSPISTYTTP